LNEGKHFRLSDVSTHLPPSPHEVESKPRGATCWPQ